MRSLSTIAGVLLLALGAAPGWAQSNEVSVTDLLLEPNPVVVIDPGHGGKDDGTKSGDGMREKALVLKFAKRLGKLLQQKAPVEVIYTRDDDYFVPLEDRTALANRHRALVFISIHANASTYKYVRGFETYFLSQNATDERARELAEAENAAAGKSPTSGGDPLSMILWDMASNENTQESFRLAELIQDKVTGALKVKNRGVRQAPFHVLLGAQMPAVLVEMGYLSNREEAKRFRSEKYLATLTEAIADGIQEYLLSLPEVQARLSRAEGDKP